MERIQHPGSSVAKALAIMLVGIIFLDCMGILIKMLSPRYSAVELSAYRNIVGMVPSVLLLLYMGELIIPWRKLIIPQWRMAFMRGIFVTFAQLSYYMALGKSEFAMVAALGHTYSLFVVAYSMPLLGEKVGPIRWAAVVLGFTGAVWIVRPGSTDFSWWAILPLCAAAFYALTSVTVRLIDRPVSTALIYMYSAVVATIASVALVMATTGFSGIQNGHDAMLIVAMGLLGGCGVLFLTLSVRLAEPSLLAPFNYLGLISAFGMGWYFFGEAPFDKLFPGILLIVGAGLMVLWRENVLRRRANRQA